MEPPRPEGSPQEEGGDLFWREVLPAFRRSLVLPLDSLWSLVNSALGWWSPAQAQAIQEHEPLKEENPQLNEELQEAEREKAEWVQVLKDITIQVRVTGRTGGCEKDFLKNVAKHLVSHDVNLKTEGSSHFLLVFCPVASSVGTDMQNAMEGFQGEPKAVLVMLHHRPREYNHFVDTKLQAQHPAVVRTVHARYTLEGGLYDCQMNKEAVATVAEVLIDHYREEQEDPPLFRLVFLKRSSGGQKKPERPRRWFLLFKRELPIQVRVTGRTGDCENQFLKKVSDHLSAQRIHLKPERYREDSGHFLLVFCPVASSVGSDMDNALEGLGSEPKAVLVMLHHKLKESSSPVDARKQAHHPAVVRTLHARYTLEGGFYACQMNEEAVAAVAEVLKNHFRGS